jgi:hypothetical protein
MIARRLLLGIAVGSCVLATSIGVAQADFRDGANFSDTATNGRLDLGPLYVFRSPANANNTVFVMTVSPFSGVLTPTTFVKGARYDFVIDTSGDLVPDIVLRATFGPPSAIDGSQSVLLRCLPKPRCRRYVLARGRTGQNIPVLGGGLFRAANQDNPEFFDQGGWDTYVAAKLGTFPRAPGTAHNFYGPNGNSLAIVLELPSARIHFPATNPNKIIAVWARTIANGGRQDRQGADRLLLANRSRRRLSCADLPPRRADLPDRQPRRVRHPRRARPGGLDRPIRRRPGARQRTPVQGRCTRHHAEPPIERREADRQRR